MSSNPIENVKLSLTCSENWDAMRQTQSGRHCDKCNKTVHDFTNSKVEEFRAIMAENNNSICGRFRKEQIAPIVIKGWRKWVSAALVVIGFNFTGCKGKVKHDNQNIAKTIKDTSNTDDLLVGAVLPVNSPDSLPEYPGGEEAFNQFLKKHRHLIKDKSIGQIYIAFDVDTNGNTNNYQILEGLNPIIDSQALNVIKKMPKWHPAIKSGKPIPYKHVVPYLIKKEE